MLRPLNIVTHHKCASTWLQRYLAEFCELNAKEFFGSHYSRFAPPASAEVVALTNASYDFVEGTLQDGVHIIRNPLDIVVSAYFSHRNTHALDGWPKLSRQREVLRSAPEADGLFVTLSFLERDDFYDGAVGPLHALRHWNYADARFQTMRMEDMVRNPGAALGSILLSRFPESVLPVDDNYSFEAMSGRRIGKVDEASHYRSGKADQWRQALPPTIVKYIRTHYADILNAFYPESADDD
jgi:hypothetical protein